MSTTISCPHCTNSMRLPDELRGLQVRCPECQGIFVTEPRTDVHVEPLPSVLPRRSHDHPEGHAEVAPPAWSPSRRRPPDDDEDDQLDEELPARRFRPAGGLGLAVTILLISSLGLSLIMLVSGWMQYNLAIRLAKLENVPRHEIDGNDLRQTALGLLHLGLYLATAIVFLVWFYRVYANQNGLGARHLNYSPGWAVGYWFVPIMNFYRPLQVAQEIWRNSDPAAGGWGNRNLVRPRNSALIGFWWAAWIINNVIGNVSFRLDMAVNSPETLKVATSVGMISDAANIIAALLAVAVVRAVDARQAARAQVLAETDDASWQEDGVRN